MERSSRFSFRRKNSQPNRDKDGRNVFDVTKMTYVSTDTARQIYGELLDEYKLSLDQILEVTGFLCASAIAKVYPKSSLHKGKGSILVCCGPGRNGAEGLVCARHLKLFGYKPTIFYPKPATDGVNQTLTDQCERHGLPFLYYLPSEAQLITDSYNAVVDAIYGFNFEGPTTHDFDHIIHTLIKTRLPIISINLPSGWSDEIFPSGDNDDSFIQPETLLSLLVPLMCSKSFKGKNHYLLGHLLLPQDLTSKFDLILPGHRDSDNSSFDMLSLPQGYHSGSPSNPFNSNDTKAF